MLSDLTMLQSGEGKERTKHKTFMIYYRAWRDTEMKGVNTSLTGENWLSMFDIPYGINIVNVFSYVPPGEEKLAEPFFKKLKEEYVPELHARGVKLTRGFNYTKLLEIPFEDDFPDEKEFDDYAKALLDELMLPWGLDGLDIDMEGFPTDDEVKIGDGVIIALSKYIGPKANNDTLFLYDTNGENTKPFENVSHCFDFIAYQQYGSGPDRTEMAANAYAAHISAEKILPGLTFPEERDPVNRWYDTILPYEQSNINQIAKYARENDLGGMFLYAFDRDGKTYEEPDLNSISPSSFLWTKTAILEVNGCSVENAKRLARHHLHRIKHAKNFTREAIETIEMNIQNAKNLYDANIAILGASYEEALNQTYDPILENELTKIDLNQSSQALSQADIILSNQRFANNLTLLKEVRNKLAELLGSKKYRENEVNSLTQSLLIEIQNVTEPLGVYKNKIQIADNVILTGKHEEKFAFSQKDISNDTFMQVNDERKGIISEVPQKVTFIDFEHSKPNKPNIITKLKGDTEISVKSPNAEHLPETNDGSRNIWVTFASVAAISITLYILFKRKNIVKY